MARPGEEGHSGNCGDGNDQLENDSTRPLLGDNTAFIKQDWAKNTKLLLSAGPALLICTFVVGFEISFITTNYSRRIAEALHDFEHASWIVLGYTITESAFLPLFGHGAHLYGYRVATLAAAGLLALGLLFSSMSFQLWELSLSQLVVGTGAAGLEVLVVIIMNNLVILYDLPLWKSALVFTDTCALMLGGPIGASLTDKLGFRPTFGIQFCLMVIGVIALYFTLRMPRPTQPKSDHAIKRFDFLGCILILLSVATPILAMNLGGDILPWSHPLEILLILLTPLFLLLFYFEQTRLAPSTIVPIRFVRMPSVVAVFAYGLPINFALDQLLFSFGTYLEARSFHHSSTFSDWALTCVWFGRPFGAIFSGLIIRRYHKFKPLLQLNIIVTVVAYICLATGLISPEKPVYAPFLFLIGFNEGISENCCLVALLSLVSAEDQLLLYAFYDLGTAITGDFGIAISQAAQGVLVRSKLHARLGNYPNGDEMIRKSLESLSYIRKLPLPIQQQILDAFTSSIEVAFALSSGVLAISLVASFLLIELPESLDDGD